MTAERITHIDRDKVTPELMTEMRSILEIGGRDTSELSDEEVLCAIELFVDAVIAVGKQFRETVLKPAVVFLSEWSQTPEAQILAQIAEKNQNNIKRM